MTRNTAVGLLIVLLFSSCFGGGGVIRDKKNTNYKIMTPRSPWRQIPSSASRLDADHAYVNPKTGSSFYVRSVCDIYKDASLDQLTQSLVRIFGSKETVSSKVIPFSGRHAKQTVFLGDLDGVQVKVNATILKKHSCFFDFVFISIPKTYDKDRPAFEDFLNSFSL